MAAGAWVVEVQVEPEGGDEKRGMCRVAFEAMCRETTKHSARPESVLAITRFHTGVSWHFRSLKDKVL